jgi:serine/threonine-protein kinase
MGQVWRAADEVLGRPVAVKLLRPEYADHPETLERFRAEARHAGLLSHPHIAQVYDYGHGYGWDYGHGYDWDGRGRFWQPYLVLEYVDGPSLAGVLERGPLGAERTRDLIAQAADGLAAAHEARLVHRDIKPGNMLLTSDGRVKLTDFGIAHAAGAAPITAPGIVMGTARYMAPERIAGGAGTPASDLYSLGIVMYECLSGRAPFHGSSADVMAAHLHQALPPLPDRVPDPLADLVAKLTAKDPSYRIRDAALLSVRLRALGTITAAARSSRHPDLPAGVYPAGPPAVMPARIASARGVPASTARAVPASTARAVPASTARAVPGRAASARSGPADPAKARAVPGSAIPHSAVPLGTAPASTAPAGAVPASAGTAGPATGTARPSPASIANARTSPARAIPGTPIPGSSIPGGAAPAGTAPASAGPAGPATTASFGQAGFGQVAPYLGARRHDKRRRGGRRRSVAVVASTAAVAGLAAGGLVAASVLRATPVAVQDVAGPGVTAAAPGGRYVHVPADGLTGRRLATVVSRLRSMGLAPKVMWAEHTGHPAGTVISVTPSGPVPAGAAVIVTVAR